MNCVASRSSSSVQNTADQQNRTNSEKSISQFQPEIPDLTFKSKTELKRLVESQCWEIAQSKQEKVNALQENLKLNRENLEYLKEINNQKRLIIELYARLNKDKEFSPLMIAAG